MLTNAKLETGHPLFTSNYFTKVFLFLGQEGRNDVRVSADEDKIKMKFGEEKPLWLVRDPGSPNSPFR